MRSAPRDSRPAWLGTRPSLPSQFVLGSGKGKALLIAGMLPYMRVVGVEIGSELSTVARRNIERFRYRRRSGIIESETASVIDWKMPDDACIVEPPGHP